MKKILILAIAIVLGTFSANAQFGGFIEKAAKKAQKKTEDKIIEKTSEKVAEKVSDAIVDQIPEPETKSNETVTVDSDEPLTYEGLMRMLPNLPSAQQMVSYKKAELNGQGLKILSSEVMKFQMTVLDLTGKVYTIPYQDADSTEISEAVYKNAELYTGLTREELDMLATMSDEEQEAYLKEHYREGQAEAAMMEQAYEVGKLMEPLQPIIDRWSSFDETIASITKECDTQCEAIYAKYADNLAATKDDDDAHHKVLLNYYEEVAPLIRESVIRCNKVRLDEQLPVALEIEEQMVPIRAEHKDVLTALINYPQLTASQYFTETLRILEIPEYPEE